MSERSGEAVKKDIENILEMYKKSFKDTMPESQYFQGYRACLESIHEDIAKIPTEK